MVLRKLVCQTILQNKLLLQIFLFSKFRVIAVFRYYMIKYEHIELI